MTTPPPSSSGLDTAPGVIAITREELPSIPDEIARDPQAARIDPRKWFREPGAPFELEIGSGKGTFILNESRERPDTNFLGIEWEFEFFEYAADRLRRAGHTNVRMLHGDAVEFLRWRCPPGIVRVIHLYFSDPWPKARHHKRRVVQEPFLRQCHRVLPDGGELRIVTDHTEYWEWMQEHFARVTAPQGEPLFERAAFEPPASAAEGELVGTNFERKYRLEGRPFHAIVLRKLPGTTASGGGATPQSSHAASRSSDPVPDPVAQITAALEATSRPMSSSSESADLASRPLLISELFHSIQGEGKLTGVPSFFIRTSGCNLRCTWCDTPYASWNPEGTMMTVEQIVDRAKQSGARHVVLTGGEPMMFPQAGDLTQALKAAGLHITIETAGTIDRAEVIADLMSISPKLSNSTPAIDDPRDPTGVWRARHDQRRLTLPALQSLLARPTDRQLKFVISTPADLVEIDDLLSRIYGWSPDDILLMPEGVTPPSAEQKAWLVAECLKRGWRYCSRLHIELFGNRRGT